MTFRFVAQHRYKPTRLWGFSGHVQTILQGVISRLSCPLVDGRRHVIKMNDGATVSYDLYQPMTKSTLNGMREIDFVERLALFTRT